MMARAYLRVMLIVLLFVVPVMVSCGGGGGGGGSTPPTPKAPGIYGTAASGLAHPHRPIEVGDGVGNHDGTTTDGDGNFVIPTTKVKTPPYLLRVITSTTPTTMLYSVSADENAATTINVTPLTDLIIRSWYSAQTPTVDIDVAFNDLVNHPAPKPDVVALIHSLVKNVVQLWLDKNGATSSDFNLISTPFTAGTSSIAPMPGLDTVLHQAVVNVSNGTLSLTDGSTTQNTTLSTFLSSLTASTTTVSQITGSTVDSGFNDLTSIPTTTATQAALAGINATLKNIADTINANGLSLTTAHLQPYLDPGMNNNGFNQAESAEILRLMAISAKMSGQPVLYKLKTIKRLDTTVTPNVAEVKLDGIGQVFFRKVSGTWLLSGNDQIASITMTAVMNTRQGNNTCAGTCDGTKMTLLVDAKQYTVSSVTVTGGGFWNTVTVPKVSAVSVSGTSIMLDRFWLDSNHLAQLPAKETPFSVIITPASGPTVSYQFRSNSYTTEPSIITNLVGSAITVAKLGNPLTVSWTKPTSYAIKDMGLSYQAYSTSRTDPNPQVCTGGVSLTGTATPSATVTIPVRCPGHTSDVISVNLDVAVNGVNGESSTVTYVIN